MVDDVQYVFDIHLVGVVIMHTDNQSGIEFAAPEGYDDPHSETNVLFHIHRYPISEHTGQRQRKYVYKLIPSMEARPATLTFIADQFPKHQIILYADSNLRSRNVEIYTNYFKEKKIPYKCIPSSKTLVKELIPGQKNIVLSLQEETAPNMMLSRELVYGVKPDDLLFIMPESMLKSNTVEVEYFSTLNVHFFSDYYVDNSNEQTQVFVHNYTERFKTPPTLENFAFQGYDVTRFFVEWLLNDKDLDLVKIEPIAYRLSFDKVPNGGYENVNVQ